MVEKKVKLCKTKYSEYFNNYDNCVREELEGCDGCEWYVSQVILNMFERFEKRGIQKDDIKGSD